jgi:hypothetical protein
MLSTEGQAGDRIGYLCRMAFDDPAKLDLAALFRDAHMFESRRAWTSAGFQVVNRVNSGKIMVAQHPSVRGLLFKKYTADVSQDDQTKNFERRVEGARELHAFVTESDLRHVVIPRKWLIELPRPFARKTYVLAVEQLDLASEDQTKTSYQRVDPDVLRDLCIVLFHFRGMDSNAKNLPFVTDGRIAFVDTEHWDRRSSKEYLHHVGEYLSRDRLQFAKTIFHRLEDGDGVRDIVGRARGRRDFSDEEDTSSSWSSSSSSSSS